VYYERGRGGLERNRQEAKRWFAVAAAAAGDSSSGGPAAATSVVNSGHPDGQYALALILLHEEHGESAKASGAAGGAEVDAAAKRAEAIELLRTAAKQVDVYLAKGLRRRLVG
jgi:TPR repeat protein